MRLAKLNYDETRQVLQEEALDAPPGPVSSSMSHEASAQARRAREETDSVLSVSAPSAAESALTFQSEAHSVGRHIALRGPDRSSKGSNVASISRAIEISSLHGGLKPDLASTRSSMGGSASDAEQPHRGTGAVAGALVLSTAPPRLNRSVASFRDDEGEKHSNPPERADCHAAQENRRQEQGQRMHPGPIGSNRSTHHPDDNMLLLPRVDALVGFLSETHEPLRPQVLHNLQLRHLEGIQPAPPAARRGLGVAIEDHISEVEVDEIDLGQAAGDERDGLGLPARQDEVVACVAAYNAMESSGALGALLKSYELAYLNVPGRCRVRDCQTIHRQTEGEEGGGDMGSSGREGGREGRRDGGRERES